MALSKRKRVSKIETIENIPAIINVNQHQSAKSHLVVNVIKLFAGTLLLFLKQLSSAKTAAEGRLKK